MGTPLSFSGSKNPDLFFCSHMDEKIPRSAKRVLGNGLALTAANPKCKDQDILSLDYNRILPFGRMDLRLLPAGLSPGSAMLEIKFNGMTIVYCNALRLATPIAGEKAEAIKCDMLLLDTPVATSQFPAPSTVKKQLVSWSDSFKNRSGLSAIVCSSKSDVFNAVAALSSLDISIFAHKNIFNMLRNTGYLTTEHSKIAPLTKKLPSLGTLLLPLKSWNSGSIFTNNIAASCIIGEGELKKPTDERFIFGHRETEKILLAFARSTGAKSVALGAAYTVQNAEIFKKAGFNVYYSKKPVQLPLPF